VYASNHVEFSTLCHECTTLLQPRVWMMTSVGDYDRFVHFPRFASNRLPPSAESTGMEQARTNGNVQLWTSHMMMMMYL